MIIVREAVDVRWQWDQEQVCVHRTLANWAALIRAISKKCEQLGNERGTKFCAWFYSRRYQCVHVY